MVKRGFLVAAGSAAIFVAGLSGCSSNETSEADATTQETAGGTAAQGAATVTIDGEEQNLEGTVVCNALGGNKTIAIGDAATGVSATVSEGDSPTVRTVGLGNIDGVTLGYQENASQGEATAEKDGDTYTISGTATGMDMANPMQPVTKPFEIEVTCP